jgi:hypothetical protein
MFRNLACLAGTSLLLSSYSASAAQPTRSERVLSEKAACKLFGTPPVMPTSTPYSFVAISVKASLISTLEKSDDDSLKDVAKDLRIAARDEEQTGNGAAMVRALNVGVAVCHRLGLSTK